MMGLILYDQRKAARIKRDKGTGSLCLSASEPEPLTDLFEGACAYYDSGALKLNVAAPQLVLWNASKLQMNTNFFTSRGGNLQYGVNLNGGMVAFGGGMVLTQRVGDTMAIIQAKDAKGGQALLRVNATEGALTVRWGTEAGEACQFQYALPPEPKRQRKTADAGGHDFCTINAIYLTSTDTELPALGSR